MKKALLLSIITVSTFVISGCSSSQDTPQPQITTYTLDSEFSEKFDVCKKDPTSCNLDRDAVIEGTITKINDSTAGDFANFVEISTVQGNTSIIPILPNTQEKRSTIIVNASGELLPFEEILVGDSIKANVKSFDVMESGEIIEKLGQYAYIQISPK